jgi:ABC-type glycerol-3-phosphate transport system substrate-binding protein
VRELFMIVSTKRRLLLVASAAAVLGALAAGGCSNNSAATSADYKKDIMGGNLTPAQRTNYEAIAKQAEQAEVSGHVGTTVSGKAAAAKTAVTNTAQKAPAVSGRPALPPSIQ